MFSADPTEPCGWLQEVATSQDVIGLDIETSGLDPMLGHICLVQLAIQGKVYVLEPTNWVAHALSLFVLRGGLVLGANLKFEAKWLLHHWGIKLNRVFDVWRASQLLYNGLSNSHDLWSIEETELGITQEQRGLADEQRSNWAIGFSNLTQSQLKYAAADVANLHRLYEVMVPKLQAEGLIPVAQVEMQVVLAEAMLELAGMPFQKQMWLDRVRVDQTLARAMEGPLLKALPSPTGQLGLFGSAVWNLSSTQQLQQSLLQLGCDLSFYDKAKREYKLSTNDETLAKNASKYPIVAELRKQREYTKGASMYGLEYLQHVHPKTGRIHSSYWPFTGAGRYSCSKPNTQQLPGEPAFRQCFAPEEGRVLVVSDLSQIELRIAAEITGDPMLVEAYNNGADIHTQSAILITGNQHPTKHDRQIAKSANFGLLYGASAETLQAYALANFGISLTLLEATAIREKFFGAYKGLRRWHTNATKPWLQNTPTRTILGRLRHLGPNSYCDRLNSPVQGTGADAIKLAMAWLVRKLPMGACLIGTCHDELVVECRQSQGENCVELTKDIMELAAGTMVTKVPVIAEAKICHSWADK